MIKKDIVYRENTPKTKKISKLESASVTADDILNSTDKEDDIKVEESKNIVNSCPEERVESGALGAIDEIFAQADADMAKNKLNTTLEAELQKKKKRRRIRRLIEVGIFVVLLLIGAVGLGVAFKHEFNKEFPVIKEAFLEQYDEIYQEIAEIDESNLSTDEFYQRKLFLLVSPEELDQMISSPTKLIQIINSLSRDGAFPKDALSKQKLDEFNMIMAEYEAALAAESEAAETGTIQSDGMTNNVPPPD